MDRFTWAEVVRIFDIAGGDEVRQFEKNMVLANANHWAIQFGKQYLIEKKHLFAPQLASLSDGLRFGADCDKESCH